MLSKLSRYVQPRILFSKYLQARIKRDCKFLFLTKQESSKIFNLFLHTKQESSKTKVAREGSIKIETRVLTPKSSRSRISSKSCSSLLHQAMFQHNVSSSVNCKQSLQQNVAVMLPLKGKFRSFFS